LSSWTGFAETRAWRAVVREPRHIQHNVPLGSPGHLTIPREADRHAGMVIDAVARERDRGDEIPLIVMSGHGHESVGSVIDVKADRSRPA